MGELRDRHDLSHFAGRGPQDLYDVSCVCPREIFIIETLHTSFMGGISMFFSQMVCTISDSDVYMSNSFCYNL